MNKILIAIAVSPYRDGYPLYEPKTVVNSEDAANATAGQATRQPI